MWLKVGVVGAGLLRGELRAPLRWQPAARAHHAGPRQGLPELLKLGSLWSLRCIFRWPAKTACRFFSIKLFGLGGVGGWVGA